MRILITGANGFIGRKALERLASRHEVLGVSLHDDIAPFHGAYRFQTLDLTDGEAVSDCLCRFRPDVVLHCAALSVIGYCESHPDDAVRVNVTSVRHLLAACRATRSRLIHLSTDNVFDGQSPLPQPEDAPTCPVNTYGRTKLQAEQLIQESGLPAVILRVVMVYGKPLPGQHSNVIELVRTRLSADEAFYAVTDQFRMPTYVEDIVDTVETLLASPDAWGTGTEIFHLCGPHALSIYDIARRTAQAFGLDVSLVRPVTTAEQQAGFVRMPYGVLDTTKAQRLLHFRPHTLEDALLAYAK